MDLLKTLSNYALLGLGGLVFVFVWGATLLAIKSSAARRGLPRMDMLFWLAIGIILPVVGFGLYGLGSLAGRLISSQAQAERAANRDSTGVRLDDAPAVLPPAPVMPRALLEDTLPPDSPAEARPCRLSLVAGPSAGYQYVLENLPLRIGRGADAAIRISVDGRVSRLHAEIYQQAGALRVRDLDSLHGTCVNGAQISDVPLQPGDRISVGETILLVVCNEERAHGTI